MEGAPNAMLNITKDLNLQAIVLVYIDHGMASHQIVISLVVIASQINPVALNHYMIGVTHWKCLAIRKIGLGK